MISSWLLRSWDWSKKRSMLGRLGNVKEAVKAFEPLSDEVIDSIGLWGCVTSCRAVEIRP